MGSRSPAPLGREGAQAQTVCLGTWGAWMCPNLLCLGTRGALAQKNLLHASRFRPLPVPFKKLGGFARARSVREGACTFFSCSPRSLPAFLPASAPLLVPCAPGHVTRLIFWLQLMPERLFLES